MEAEEVEYVNEMLACFPRWNNEHGLNLSKDDLETLRGIIRANSASSMDRHTHTSIGKHPIYNVIIIIENEEEKNIYAIPEGGNKLPNIPPNLPVSQI